MKKILKPLLIHLSIIFISFGCVTVDDFEVLSSPVYRKYIDKDRQLNLEFKEMHYVPAYSNLFYKNGNTKLNFAVVLSIRNTSAVESIFITSVDLRNSKGKSVRKYVSREVELAPLGSTEFIVNYNDNRSGPGANFIVEYGAENEIQDTPIIESVNIGHYGRHGFSFSSQSKKISNFNEADTFSEE
ncbi:DUF3124 domain-containing protein [Flammeovirga pectinis]|uniref:DUF3124 domain-containing protein n=1 Tax=Flammeovirga pectinis TaxID=2494373 RepID=A0A3Q9FLF9_9BACT|nr:DUF3124 domain-containing protein [Flammeovirga pectinis]AZQ60901.1 DUF3124 domain-containing protein [Flammeovirga pectinis]